MKGRKYAVLMDCVLNKRGIGIQEYRNLGTWDPKLFYLLTGESIGLLPIAIAVFGSIQVNVLNDIVIPFVRVGLRIAFSDGIPFTDLFPMLDLEE